MLPSIAHCTNHPPLQHPHQTLTFHQVHKPISRVLDSTSLSTCLSLPSPPRPWRPPRPACRSAPPRRCARSTPTRWARCAFSHPLGRALRWEWAHGLLPTRPCPPHHRRSCGGRARARSVDKISGDGLASAVAGTRLCERIIDAPMRLRKVSGFALARVGSHRAPRGSHVRDRLLATCVRQWVWVHSSIQHRQVPTAPGCHVSCRGLATG